VEVCGGAGRRPTLAGSRPAGRRPVSHGRPADSVRGAAGARGPPLTAPQRPSPCGAGSRRLRRAKIEEPYKMNHEFSGLREHCPCIAT
jgi:hypothetical protein